MSGPQPVIRPEFGPLSIYDDSCPHTFVDISIGPNQYSSVGAHEQYKSLHRLWVWLHWAFVLPTHLQLVSIEISTIERFTKFGLTGLHGAWGGPDDRCYLFIYDPL